MFRERDREVSGLAGLGKRAAGLQLCVVIYLFVSTCERDDRVRDPRGVREVAVYIYTVFDLMLPIFPVFVSRRRREHFPGDVDIIISAISVSTE